MTTAPVPRSNTRVFHQEFKSCDADVKPTQDRPQRMKGLHGSNPNSNLLKPGKPV
jgi:hypothetical protein